MDTTYIDRMREEEEQLSERITKLKYFIHLNNSYHDLTAQKKDLLQGQLHAMELYYLFLSKRLSIEEQDTSTTNPQ